MGAQSTVVIVEVDDSLNDASTGKITIQKLVVVIVYAFSVLSMN